MLIAAGLARNSRLYRNARVSTLVLKRAKSCLFSEGSMIFSYVFRAELAIQSWSVGGSYTTLQHHKTKRPVTQAQWDARRIRSVGEAVGSDMGRARSHTRAVLSYSRGQPLLAARCARAA